MFLRERIRKVVGVATPSDLAGSSSIVFESDYSGILHCGEGGDVEQVAPISITILYLCNWLAFDLSNSYSFIFLHKYTCYFYSSLKIICLNSLYTKKAIVHLNSYLRGITRKSSELFMGYTTSFLGCEFGFVYVLISLCKIIIDKFLFFRID